MTGESERIAPKPFWFRLVTRVSGVAVVTESPSTLKYPGEDRISIQFRQPLESEVPEETRNHPQYETPAIFDCVGTATMRHTVPRKVRKALLENDIKLEWIPQIEDYVWDVPEELKPSLDPFVKSIHSKLTNALHAAYRVLRWRYALGGTVTPFSSARLEWSRTGRKWSELPSPFAPIWIDWNLSKLSFSPSEAEETKLFLRNGTQEPVAHELFREAWDQCAESPRAALVIGMAAAEIGVKDFIAQRVPEAAWLMKETAMQDWIKLLSDYLPTLQGEAPLRFVPEWMIGGAPRTR